MNIPRQSGLDCGERRARWQMQVPGQLCRPTHFTSSRCFSLAREQRPYQYTCSNSATHNNLEPEVRLKQAGLRHTTITATQPLRGGATSHGVAVHTRIPRRLSVSPMMVTFADAKCTCARQSRSYQGKQLGFISSAHSKLGRDLV